MSDPCEPYRINKRITESVKRLAPTKQLQEVIIGIQKIIALENTGNADNMLSELTKSSGIIDVDGIDGYIRNYSNNIYPSWERFVKEASANEIAALGFDIKQMSATVALFSSIEGKFAAHVGDIANNIFQFYRNTDNYAYSNEGKADWVKNKMVGNYSFPDATVPRTVYDFIMSKKNYINSDILKSYVEVYCNRGNLMLQNPNLRKIKMIHEEIHNMVEQHHPEQLRAYKRAVKDYIKKHLSEGDGRTHIAPLKNQVGKVVYQTNYHWLNKYIKLYDFEIAGGSALSKMTQDELDTWFIDQFVKEETSIDKNYRPQAAKMLLSDVKDIKANDLSILNSGYTSDNELSKLNSYKENASIKPTIFTRPEMAPKPLARNITYMPMKQTLTSEITGLIQLAKGIDMDTAIKLWGENSLEVKTLEEVRYYENDFKFKSYYTATTSKDLGEEFIKTYHPNNDPGKGILRKSTQPESLKSRYETEQNKNNTTIDVLSSKLSLQGTYMKETADLLSAMATEYEIKYGATKDYYDVSLRPENKLAKDALLFYTESIRNIYNGVRTKEEWGGGLQKDLIKISNNSFGAMFSLMAGTWLWKSAMPNVVAGYANASYMFDPIDNWSLRKTYDDALEGMHGTVNQIMAEEVRDIYREHLRTTKVSSSFRQGIDTKQYQELAKSIIQGEGGISAIKELGLKFGDFMFQSAKHPIKSAVRGSEVFKGIADHISENLLENWVVALPVVWSFNKSENYLWKHQEGIQWNLTRKYMELQLKNKYINDPEFRLADENKQVTKEGAEFIKLVTRQFDSLHGAEIFKIAKELYGDFFSDAKPIYATYSMREAENLRQAIVGAGLISQHMFKQVLQINTQTLHRSYKVLETDLRMASKGDGAMNLGGSAVGSVLGSFINFGFMFNSLHKRMGHLLWGEDDSEENMYSKVNFESTVKMWATAVPSEASFQQILGDVSLATSFLIRGTMPSQKQAENAYKLINMFAGTLLSGMYLDSPTSSFAKYKDAIKDIDTSFSERLKAFAMSAIKEEAENYDYEKSTFQFWGKFGSVMNIAKLEDDDLKIREKYFDLKKTASNNKYYNLATLGPVGTGSSAILQFFTDFASYLNAEVNKKYVPPGMTTDEYNQRVYRLQKHQRELLGNRLDTILRLYDWTMAIPASTNSAKKWQNVFTQPYRVDPIMYDYKDFYDRSQPGGDLYGNLKFPQVKKWHDYKTKEEGQQENRARRLLDAKDPYYTPRHLRDN